MQLDYSTNPCKLLVENATDYALILTDPEDRVIEWNAGAMRMFGYRDDEMLGTPVKVLFTPEDRGSGEPERETALALSSGRSENERWLVRKDGSRFLASGVAVPLITAAGQTSGFAKILRDLTERETARERFEASAREHAALIGEIHHRVKNNLQVIVSMFSLQAHRTTQPDLLDMLGRMQNRVRAISQLYAQLYSFDNTSTVHFGEYLSNLVSEVESFYDPGPGIEVQISAADLALDIDQALPLALISNELLSNAFEHAFPDNRSGKISVTLRYAQGAGGDLGDRCELAIADDGAGLPRGFDFRTADSMGFHVVRILSQQLAGMLAVDRDSGTSICLSLPLKEERCD